MQKQRKLHPIKQASHSIASVANLCSALGVSRNDFEAARKLAPEDKYRRGEVRKKDGSVRTVHNPHFYIRRIQRRINHRIFANSNVVRWPDHIFGSVPNDDFEDSNVLSRDYVNCAARHCGAKSILSIDIKDFFDNIHISQVDKIFKDFFKYPDDVASALLDVCCTDDGIVQGALTSSYLATLCLWDLEGDLVRRLSYKNLIYTRLVDDITVSSKLANYDFGYARSEIEKMLSAADLPINSQKTEVRYSAMKPLLVHGLRVDFSTRLPPDEPRRIRAAVKNLEILATSPGYRASRSYRKDFNKCMGRVNKLARVRHIQHGPLVERLKKILPLASHNDIEKANQIVGRLAKDLAKRPGYEHTYWFYKRYFVALERLVVLQRSFPKTAAALREQLRVMRPKVPHE